MGQALKLVHTTPHTTPHPTPHPTPCTATHQGAAPSDGAEEREVFDAWVLLHRHAAAVRPRWTPERQQCIAQALGWGFGVGELVWVCVGALSNAFCQGDNRARRKFDDLVWLLGTPERIERLANEGAEVERAAARRAKLKTEPAAVPEADAMRVQQARDRLALLREELLARRGAR